MGKTDGLQRRYTPRNDKGRSGRPALLLRIDVVDFDDADASGVVYTTQLDRVGTGREHHEHGRIFASVGESESTATDRRGRDGCGVVTGRPIVVSAECRPGGVLEGEERIGEHRILTETETGECRTDTTKEHAARSGAVDHETGDKDVAAGADGATGGNIGGARARGGSLACGRIVDFNQYDAGAVRIGT